jgi:hypothetical protein
VARNRRREPVTKPGIDFACSPGNGVRGLEGVMAHAITARRFFGGIGTFFEHVAVVIIGFVLMVVGLALGVTMIMLPVGLAVGLLGVGLVVAGLFARLNDR